MAPTLKSLFQLIAPLSDELLNKIDEFLIVENFRKGKVLLKEGQVSNFIYFIEKGFVRCYYKQGQKQVNAWFMEEGNIIISVKSFFNQEKSHESIELLEDSTLHYISFDHLQYLYRNYVAFNIIGRVLTEKYYILSEERLYFMRQQKAEDRYKLLFSNYPQIFERVSLSHISSYLGVSLETLSRIRAKRII